MFIRMTKALLALGLMAAAGSSAAFYVVSGSGVQLTQKGYCGQVWYSNQTGQGVMSTTMVGCTTQLNAISGGPNVAAVEACHVCNQRFVTVPETGYVLPPRVVRQFLEGSQALREQFRIDEFERAQEEFERSLAIEPKP